MNSRQFFYEFGRLFYKIDAFYAEIAKEQCVKPNLLWILYALDDGNAHSQKEISVTWDIPLSTINTIIVDLNKNGYVDFVAVPGEKREKHIILTEKGKEFSAKTLKKVYEMEDRAFNSLGERRRISEDLQHLLNALKDAKGE